MTRHGQKRSEAGVVKGGHSWHGVCPGTTIGRHGPGSSPVPVDLQADCRAHTHRGRWGHAYCLILQPRGPRSNAFSPVLRRLAILHFDDKIAHFYAIVCDKNIL